MGITLTPSEELAYLAVWRHIGYYLGISPARLERYYNNVSSASKLFASNTMHLFNTDSSREDPTSTSTYRLLSAVANRPPQYLPVEHSLALSRILLGNGLAGRLAIPKTARWRVLRIRATFALERYLDFFGKHYRASWEVERVEMTRMLLMMVVCWQLGTRRTKFTIKAFMADGMGKLVEEGTAAVAAVSKSKADQEQVATSTTDKSSTLERTADVPGDEKPQIEEPTPQNPDDDTLDPEVLMGPEAGRAIIKRWKWLLGEMAVVSMGVGLGLVGVVGAGLWFSGGYGMLMRSWRVTR